VEAGLIKGIIVLVEAGIDENNYLLKQKLDVMTVPYAKAVLPNLCAAAHKCVARAVEVCRDRMSEIKSFQWEVSLKFSTVIGNVQFPTFSHDTLLPLHHNIIIMITQS